MLRTSSAINNQISLEVHRKINHRAQGHRVRVVPPGITNPEGILRMDRVRVDLEIILTSVVKNHDINTRHVR